MMCEEQEQCVAHVHHEPPLVPARAVDSPHGTHAGEFQTLLNFAL
jgi:hypothetical protein